MTLSDIFAKHGTDKLAHGYAEVYEDLFKGRTVKNLLEVGVGTLIPGVNSSMNGFAGKDYKPGASLRAWSEYFPNANIVGLDIQPDTLIKPEGRIRVYDCDSTSLSDVRYILESRRFDVIIDDGSHHATDQISTFRNLWPYLRSGGVYVIEDIVFPLDESDFEGTGIKAVAPMFLTPKTVTMAVIDKA